MILFSDLKFIDGLQGEVTVTPLLWVLGFYLCLGWVAACRQDSSLVVVGAWLDIPKGLSTLLHYFPLFRPHKATKHNSCTCNRAIEVGNDDGWVKMMGAVPQFIVTATVEPL